MAEEEVPIPSTSTSYDAYQARLQKSALVATKHAFQIPSDLGFHRTLDKSFASELDSVSARVFSLTDKLLRYSTGASTKGKGKAVLKTEEDFLDNYHLAIVDVVDQLFENADKYVDEISGRSKPVPAPKEAAKPTPLPPKKTDKLPAQLLHAEHLQKPQLRFKNPVDNTSSGGPQLSKKYNAMIPLGQSLADLSLDRMDEDDDLLRERSSHPYVYETVHLEYPERLFQTAEPIQPASYEDTPFTWVDTAEALENLLVKLRKAKEIAVDLEYHSMRSYYGFVCLMQISTREEDWIVDTLALREELEELNEVFTDPNIVKVFHGAESDIVWLQQDFNLYIVNLFDTYHASFLLGGFPKNGLASLLSHFCQFDADKRYQLADWRIRPLPEEMMFYARSDTHFLLYVYDCLRNLLLDRSGGGDESVRRVLQSSNRTALQVYRKDAYDVEEGQGNNGWDLFLSKFGTSGLGAISEIERRKAIVVAIHIWRDRVSRELDEGPRYVLSNHLIYRIANLNNPLNDIASLLIVCAPASPIVRERAAELLDIIKTAKLPAALQKPLDGIPARTEIVVEATAPQVGTTAVAIPLPDLWSTAGPTSLTAQPKIATGSSSLFSATSKTHLPVLSKPPSSTFSFTSRSSALFGPSVATSSQNQTMSTVSGTAESSRRMDLVRKVQESLHLNSIAPSPLHYAVDSSADAMALDTPQDTTDAAAVDPTVLEMPAEVEFVPASQRTTIQAATRVDSNTGDTIVVVGRKKDKKKKDKQSARLVAESTGASGSSSSTPAPAPSEEDQVVDDDDEVVAFDYTSVPNILDDDDNDEHAKVGQKRGKKQKQKGGEKGEKGNKRAKGPTVQYGNFPAPPRNRAEPRAGNKSLTFK